MKIAIIGTGGVGGYYGGLLAKDGHEVTFLARGAHLAAIQGRGLQVKSIFGDFTISPARATDDPERIGPVDLIIFCVKTYDTDEVARRMSTLLTQNTTVLSLQNGIDAHERLGKYAGPERVIGGATWISAAIEAPGVIKQLSQFRRVVIGEMDGKISARVQAIFEAFKKTGITVEISQDIRKTLWTKFVFIATASCFGALTRLSMGDWRSQPETRLQIIGLMKEVQAVGIASGVNLDADVAEKSLAFLDSSAAHLKPSMQVDVEAGKQFELDSLVGVICQKGREEGIPTPVADMIYACLLPVNVTAQKTSTI